MWRLFFLLVVPTACFAPPGLARPSPAALGAKKAPAKPFKRNNRPKGAGRTAQNGRRGEMLSTMVDKPVTVDAAASETEMNQHALLRLVRAIAAAIDDRKGREITAYFVAPHTAVCSFVLVANGRSKPQNDAIAATIVKDVRESFQRQPRVEGGSEGGWTLVDYGDVIVNIMTPRSREFYNLDQLWSKASVLDLSDVISPDSGVDNSDDNDDDNADDDFLVNDDDIFGNDDDYDDPWVKTSSSADEKESNEVSPWL